MKPLTDGSMKPATDAVVTKMPSEPPADANWSGEVTLADGRVFEFTPADLCRDGTTYTAMRVGQAVRVALHSDGEPFAISIRLNAFRPTA